MTALQKSLCRDVVSGLSNAQIAQIRGMTVRQVRRHLDKIGKLPEVKVYGWHLRKRIRTYVLRGR